MEDLGSRTKALMYEIEFVHLKRDWLERLAAGGVDRKDGRKWVAEIGHVVDEYERSLEYLFRYLEISEISRAAEHLLGWTSNVDFLTIWKLSEMCRILNGDYEKYLFPASHVSSRQKIETSEELKTRINALMEDIEHVHLKRDWAGRMVTLGVSVDDTLKCATGIGKIVNEYKLHLIKLVDLLGTRDTHEAARSLETWIVYVRDVSIRRISDALPTIVGSLEKYLPPPDPEDEDE